MDAMVLRPESGFHYQLWHAFVSELVQCHIQSLSQGTTTCFISSPRGQNGRSFADDIFGMRFSEWKVLYFDSYFTEICS